MSAFTQWYMALVAGLAKLLSKELPNPQEQIDEGRRMELAIKSLIASQGFTSGFALLGPFLDRLFAGKFEDLLPNGVPRKETELYVRSFIEEHPKQWAEVCKYFGLSVS